jgi:stage II sporulation protein E
MATSIHDKPSRGILAILRERTSKSIGWSFAVTAARHIAVFGLSILLARVEFIGGIFPFGLALVMGIPDRFFIAALSGFVVNNWIGETIVGANSAYIAAVGVVAALRWILAGMSRGKYRRSFYPPCLAAGTLSVAITEIAILVLTASFSAASFGRMAGGIALAGSFSYFYHITFDALKRRRVLNELSSTQKASVALALCTALMAFYPLNIGPFSTGRLAAAAVSVLAAYLLAPPLDSAVFVSAAAAIALCEPPFVFAGAGLCVAGVLASLFKKKGKAWLCLIFIVAAALMALTAQNYVYSLTYISEVLFASLVFLALPLKGVGELKFAKLSDSLNSATAAIGLKLDSITSSMRDVNMLLDKTIPSAARQVNFGELYSRVVETVCRNCALASYCWVKCYDDSTESLHKLTAPLCEKGSVTKADFPVPFNLRCTNMPGLAHEITERYSAMSESIARAKNASAYKGMIKKQFGAVCDMLDSARAELTAYKEWDEVKSKRLYDCALRLHLPVETASCVYDDNKRPAVTIALRDSPPDTLIRRLTAGASVIVGSTLNAPSVELSGGSTVLFFTERPAFNIRTASSQLCAEGKQCGDVYSVFSDLKGDVHILLSDGMGAGSVAAREGTICCAFLKRLLESGFPIQRAAELANSALSLRENTESACTVDVLSLNVYTGLADVFKAGAAPTFFLQGDRIVRLDSHTLPVGILEDVVSKQQKLQLSDGDIVVMVSDGVQEEGFFAIEETLKTSFGATPEELCREIIRRVQDQRGLQDDITVIVARLARYKDKEKEDE